MQVDIREMKNEVVEFIMTMAIYRSPLQMFYECDRITASDEYTFDLYAVSFVKAKYGSLV